MEGKERPFVCTKGAGIFNIAPRNREGWIYMAFWLLPALVIVGLFAWIMEGGDGDTQATTTATIGFVFGMVVWVVAMVRWMYPRSEIIDVRELKAAKRKRDRPKS